MSKYETLTMSYTGGQQLLTTSQNGHKLWTPGNNKMEMNFVNIHGILRNFLKLPFR